MTSRILLRRGTADQWSSVNPILSTGELGIETDTLKIKIGNGTSTWNQLTSYANVTPSQLTSEINNLINAAPATLDTLNELAAAINNDASFSTTVNNLLTGKVSKSGGDTITASTASTVGLIIKGAASQTANLQEWQDSAGTVLAKVDSSGNIYSSSTTIWTGYNRAANGAALYNFTTVAGATYAQAAITRESGFNGNLVIGQQGTGAVLVKNGSAAAIGLIVKGTASQTANLQEWQNSAGSVLSYVTSSGSLRAPFLSDTAGTGAFIQMNAASSVTINSRSETNVGLVVFSATSQTADLQQWQNNSGTILSGVNAAGQLYFGSSSVVQSGAVGLASVTGDGTNATYTATSGYTIANPFIAGAKVTVSGYTGITGYNGTFTIASVGGTSGAYTFTVANTTTGTPGGAGASYQSVDLSLTSENPWATPFIVKAAASQAGNLTEWQNSSGTVLARITSTGTISGTNGLSATGGSITGVNSQANSIGSAIFGVNWAVTAGGATLVPIVARGAASQTANLQEWQNSSGTVLARIDANGQGALKSTTLTASSSGGSALTLVAASGQTAPLLIAPGGTQINSSGNYLITPGLTVNYVSNFHAGASNVTPIYIRGAASQTANLQEWQDSAGTVLTKITSDGKVIAYGDDLGNFQSIGLSSTLYNGFTTTTNNNSGSYTLGTAGASETTFNVPNAFYIYDRINGAMRFKIMSTGLVGINSFNPAAQLEVNSSSASTVGAIIKGSASQTANLQEWQDSTGAVKMSVNKFGSIVASAGGTYISTFGDALFGARNATTIPLTVKGAASQTANLQEWQSSNGTVQSRMTDIGKLFSNYLQSSYGILTGNATYAGGYNFISNPSFATTDVSLIVKAVASQTANLQEWQDSAGTVLVSVLSNGRTTIRSNGSDYGAALSVGTNSTTAVGLAVRGVTSQTANLQEWQNSAGTVVSSISNAGLATFSNVGVTNNINAYYGKISANTQALGYLGQLSAITANASTIGLVIRGFASQTANLQEWQDSSSTVLASIIANGNLRGFAGLYGTNSAGTANYPLFVTNSVASTTVAVIKGAASQTADLQQWHNSAGTVLVRLQSDGTISSNTSIYAPFYQPAGGGGSYLSMTSGSPVTAITLSASVVPFMVKAAASQTADLQQWQNSAGSIVSSIGPTGAASLSAGNYQYQYPTVTIGDAAYGFSAEGGYLRYYTAYASGLGGHTWYGGPNNTYGRMVLGNNGSFVLKGVASQTANLQEWQDSAGSVLAKITASGSLELNGKDIELMNIMGAF